MNWKLQLEAHEANRQWRDAVVLMEQTIEQCPDDAEAWVRIIFLLHNILLEVHSREYESQGLKHEELAAKLLHYFNESSVRFKENPEFLFFVGMILPIAEWYFGQKSGDKTLADEMRRKAETLEPTNRLYRWAADAVLPGEASMRHTVATSREILNEDGPEVAWLMTKGFPGQYVLDRRLKEFAGRDENWFEKNRKYL